MVVVDQKCQPARPDGSKIEERPKQAGSRPRRVDSTPWCGSVTASHAACQVGTQLSFTTPEAPTSRLDGDVAILAPRSPECLMLGHTTVQSVRE